MQKVASNVKTTAEETVTKRAVYIPDTYVLVLGFVVMAVLLTHLIPAGSYDTITDAGTGRQVIDPTSFQHISATPVGLMAFLLSLSRGMVEGSTVIFLVFLVGGYFQIISDTGAIDAAIGAAVRKLQDRSLLVIPFLTVMMAGLGSLGITNSTIALIPIGILLAKKLRLDAIVAVAVIYLGAYVGFSGTPWGPFNTILAQSIADVQPMSGFGLRAFFFLVLLTVTVVYTLRYARRIQEFPNQSLLSDLENKTTLVSGSDSATEPFTWNHATVLFTLVLGFVVYAYGTFKLDWTIHHLAAVMFAVALMSGAVSRMHPDCMAKSFIVGCKSMVYGALVIGFAKSITIVLNDGNIIHSLIHYMSLPLGDLPDIISGMCMFYINLLFNFFVPSGSGQAMIVMPLFAPMADVIGISRQIAVSAYQYGDGFSNTIIPTSGVLMAVLGVAKIPFDRWIKFMMPLFGIWVLIGTVAIALGVAIGWS